MILADNGSIRSARCWRRRRWWARQDLRDGRPDGSPTVLAAQDVLFDAGVLQLFPLTAADSPSSSIRRSRRKG